MTTTEEECIEALQRAADELGESPTKAQYEALELTPASATIIRVMGSWNEAKEAAGLETYQSTGTRVGSKPDDVELPAGTAWADLSVDQRWHFRNVDWNTARTLNRRARLRAWANELKHDRGCTNCVESDPACLDFHHLEGDEKEMAITEMITYGYGRDALRDEIEKCAVLCANCHRKEHDDRRAGDVVRDGESHSDRPPMEDDPVDHPSMDDREQVRVRVREYKRRTGGCTRCSEDDPTCLDFHHEGDEKDSTVAALVSDGHPFDVVREEIANCMVLCANCHRKEHFVPPR